MNEGAGHAPTGLDLVDLVIILGTALFFVTAFRRLGLGAVLGYLVTGALLGPQGLGIVGEAEAMLRVADIGIALLLFLVGLELHPSRLWRLKQDIFGLGALQVVLTGLVLAALLYGVTGLSAAASLAVGLPLALSSTAQVLPSLRSSGDINTRGGERAFSILLLQDLAIVPMIIVVAAMSRAPTTTTPPGGTLVLYAIAAFAGLVLVGRYLINPLFRLVGRVSERELFVVAGLFTVLAAGAVMESLHLSMALGAFIAGVMLSESPYRHELEADIEPFRSILLGLFFIAVGMLLDLSAIASRPLFVVGMAAALVAVKAIILFGIARAFGVENRRAIKLGLLLSQGGEFGFVLFAEAQRSILIEPSTASLFSAIVTLSMATTPFLMMLNAYIDRRTTRTDSSHLDGPDQAHTAKAIIVGFGRFGQTVTQMLLTKGVSVTLIDSKPSQIELSGTFGVKVYYGDGSRLDLLRLAGAAEAQAILFCIDGTTMNPRRLEPILEAFPQAAVFVRAYDRRHVMELDEVDVAGVFREVFESYVTMAKQALHCLGVEDEEVARIEEEFRARDLERLAGQTASRDIRAMQQTLLRPTAPPPLPEDQPS